MNKTRLAAALSIALIGVPLAQAAQYQVVELPVADKGQDSFPSSINADGQITVNVQPPYGPPIDISLLDFESQSLIENLTDIDSARVGDFNLVDYTIVISSIIASSGSQFFQHVAETISFISNPQSSEFIAGFDQPAEVDGEYTLSTTTTVRAINNSGSIVGAGEGLYYTVPYTLTDGTETAFVVNDFSNRGFVGIQGKTVPLLPIDTTLGGISEAYDINENNQVVGYGTTALESASLQTAVDNCSDEDLRADVPFESCIKTLIDSYSANLVATSQTRGMIWQLDNDGEVLASTELGILLTPDADDTTIYASRAVAINDNGIAVGTSSAEYEISNVIINRSFATIFDGEQLINLTPEADETALRTLSSPLVSSAVDINNDNLVVGYQLKSVNGNVRTKFFVYDMDVGELIFPADFFLGSSSAPLSVNNNGLVVGYGEVDASRSARRNSGFLYDHNNQTFTDINTLLACDSPYTILQGNGINDNNEIIATARVETEIRDAKGQILLGDDGNTIIREAVIAVKLEPIPGGQVDSCELPANSQTRDRQGASMSWLLLLAGFAFGAGRIRRWTKS